MTAKESVFKLFSTYMEGWRENDIKKIIFPLSDNCKVIESHGPIYYGIDEIKKWFDLWIEANSRIEMWDIRSFYYCEEASVFEWEFSCVSNQQQYAFPGITVVKCFQEKIILLHEYRMTNPGYNWDKMKLQSE